MNEICLGRGAYGAGAAAATYFGKSLAELNVDEAAFLPGLSDNPPLFDVAKKQVFSGGISCSIECDKQA